MTFFRFELKSGSLSAGRLIGAIRAEFRKLLNVDEPAAADALQSVAEKTGMSNGDLRKMIDGETPMSLRSVAELADALDRDVAFVMTPRESQHDQSYVTETSTIRAGSICVAGRQATFSTTLTAPPRKSASRGPDGRAGGRR